MGYPTSWPSTGSGRAATLPEPVEGKTRQFSFDLVLVVSQFDFDGVWAIQRHGLRQAQAAPPRSTELTPNSHAELLPKDDMGELINSQL